MRLSNSADQKKLEKGMIIEKEEAENLKRLYQELQEFDEEIIEKHEMIKKVHDRILVCFHKLNEIIQRMDKIKSGDVIQESIIENIEKEHSAIRIMLEDTVFHFDKMKKEDIEETKNIDKLETQLKIIEKHLGKNEKRIRKIKEDIIMDS